MFRFVALVVIVAVVALPTAEAEPVNVYVERSLGAADGTLLGGTGNVVSVTTNSGNETIVAGWVTVALDFLLSPSGIASHTVAWSLNGPEGTLCSYFTARPAGTGQERVGQYRECALTNANGTFFVNVTSNTQGATVFASVRPVVVQETRVDQQMTEITTSLDPWVPYIILALLFIGAARANAFGVAFVAALAIGLTAAGNPWPAGAVALFAMAAGLAWWLPEWYRNYRARRATKGGAQ